MIALLAFFLPFVVQAQGLSLESQVVLINAGDGEGVMTLKNTDTQPILLYSSVETVEQDPVERVLVTPPVARIEPGESQVVRFILKNGEQLTTEKFARAIFEGIPPASKSNTLRLTIRQNVPLIIHPASLVENDKPWEFLTLSKKDNGDIAVKNAGPYVVRLSTDILILPGNAHARLPRNYLLPGETVNAVQAVAAPSAITATSAKISPASLYGVLLDAYELPLSNSHD